MSNTKNTSTGGIGFLGLLTIVFITLKLCGVINWSWVWVLSPLWIGFAVVAAVLGVMAIGFIFVGIAIFFAWLFGKCKGKR
jgi:hypothetical protein